MAERPDSTGSNEGALREYLHRLCSEIGRARYAFALLKLHRQGDLQSFEASGMVVPIFGRYLEEAVVSAMGRLFDRYNWNKPVCIEGLYKMLTDLSGNDQARGIADELYVLMISATPRVAAGGGMRPHEFAPDEGDTPNIWKLRAQGAPFSGLAQSFETLRWLRDSRVAHADQGALPTPLPSVPLSEVDPLIEGAARAVSR